MAHAVAFSPFVGASMTNESPGMSSQSVPMTPSGRRSFSKISQTEVNRLYDVGQRAIEDLLRHDAALKWRPVQSRQSESSTASEASDVESDIVLSQGADTSLFSLKGTAPIHATVTDVMRVLCVKEPKVIQKVYSRFFGSAGTSCSVYYVDSDDRDTVDDRIFSLETLELKSLSFGEVDGPKAPPKTSQSPRKYSYLRYGKPVEVTRNSSSGQSTTDGSGVCVWETVDAKQGPPAGNSTFHRCGFIVEPNTDNQVRLSFILSHPLDAAGAQGGALSSAAYFVLLRMVRSTLRGINGAIVDYRLLYNLALPKHLWTDATQCATCAKGFKMFRTKHHCRHCGDAICSNCSIMREGGQASRTCTPCIEGSPSTMRRHMSKLPTVKPVLVMPDPANGKLRSASLTRMLSDSSIRHSDDLDRLRPNASSAPTPKQARQIAVKDDLFDLSKFDGLLDPNVHKSEPPRQAPKEAPQPAPVERAQDITESTPLNYDLTFKGGNAWPDPPEAPHDATRLQKALELDLLHPRDEANTYVMMASRALNCPVAAVTIVGDADGLVISKVGIQGETVPRNIMLESHVLMSPEPLIVLDCLNDFMTNPLVCQGKNGIRFYIGVPLVTSDGCIVGSLSVVDTKPRSKVPHGELHTLILTARTLMRRFEDAAS
ncbi:unnamed protein product [Aphanomyces euteiches]